MIDNKTFNQKIVELEKLTESSASDTFRLIKNTKFYSRYNWDYCDFLDSFAYELGLGFSNIPVFHETKDNIIGYFPTLRFYPDNVFNEKVRDVELSSEFLNLKLSSKILAKEVLYQIMKFNNLQKFIKEKYLN